MKDIEIIINTGGISKVNLWFHNPDEEVEAVLFLEKIAAALDSLDTVAKQPGLSMQSVSFEMIERLIVNKAAEGLPQVL